MNNAIDYSKYSITSTSQFDNGLVRLRDGGHTAEIKKLFRVIDEIIQDVNMYEKEYSRQLENSNKMYHIHLDGRQTGDIVLIYHVDGHDIDLDLRLYNITDHKNLSDVSKPKYTNRQQVHEFDVIQNKYTQDQIDYGEECYLNIISDYKFHQLKGEARKQYTEEYLKTYFENSECSDPLTFDQFMEIIYYTENKHHKSIFGSIDFYQPQHTASITSREEQYIMNLFTEYDVDVEDAYVETEVDGHGDTYETMYVVTYSDTFQNVKLLESELYSLDRLFGIMFTSEYNGSGEHGRTFEFSHYFVD